MPAEEQHVKEQHSKAKRIVPLGPPNALKALPLQFWRRIRGDTNEARKQHSSVADLKAVTIDQGYPGVARNQEIAVIDVTDHLSCIVDRSESPCDIRAGMEDEGELCLGKLHSSAFGRVKQVCFVISIDPGHQKPFRLAGRAGP